MVLLKKIYKKIKDQSRRTLALGVMAALAISSVVSVSAFSKQVSIKDRNETINFSTIYEKTDEILKQANIIISQEDKIEITHDSPKFKEIKIKRAFLVNLTFKNQTHTFVFNDGKVKDVLKLAGINLSELDKVEPGLETVLYPDMDIIIKPGFNLTINIEGQPRVVLAYQTQTVKEMLEENSIDLAENQSLNVDINTLVSEDMVLNIDKTEIKEEQETQEIPFETTYKDDSSINKGETKIQTKGINGIKDVKLLRKFVNGTIIETNILSENIITQPTTQVVLRGTKSKIKISNTAYKENTDGTITGGNGTVYNFKSKLRGSITAYTGDKNTSTGVKPHYGHIAVNPKIIPYGSKVYVEGVGIFTAVDTGGALMDGRTLVDIYMDSESTCRNFGRQTKNVYIIK